MKKDRYFLRYLTRPVGDARIPMYMYWLGVVLLGVTLIFILPIAGAAMCIKFTGATLFTLSPAMNEMRNKIFIT